MNQQIEHGKKDTPITLSAILAVIIVAILGYGGWYVLDRTTKINPKIACSLLHDPFNEVGHTEDWYRLTAAYLIDHCDSDYYKRYAEAIATRQICKTNYVNDRLAGKPAKECADMKLF